MYDLNGTPGRGGGEPTLGPRFIPLALTTIDVTEVAASQALLGVFYFGSKLRCWDRCTYVAG